MFKGIDNIIFYLIIIASLILGYFVIPSCYNYYSELITFLSILIGFQITALSILFNSRILKVLYDKKDKTYKTELHRLKVYFAYSIYFEITSIILLLVLQNEYEFTIINYDICFYKSFLVLPIIFGSVYCFLKISNDFFRIFVLPRNE